MLKNHHRMREVYANATEGQQDLIDRIISDPDNTNTDVMEQISALRMDPPSRATIHRFRRDLEKSGLSVHEALDPYEDIKPYRGGNKRKVTMERYETDMLYSTAITNRELAKQLEINVESLKRLRREAWQVLRDDVDYKQGETKAFAETLRNWVISLPNRQARSKALMVVAHPRFRATVISALIGQTESVTERTLAAWRIQVGSVEGFFPRVRTGALDFLYDYESFTGSLLPYLQGTPMDECLSLKANLEAFHAETAFKRLFDNVEGRPEVQKSVEALSLTDEDMQAVVERNYLDDLYDLDDLDDLDDLSA